MAQAGFVVQREQISTSSFNSFPRCMGLHYRDAPLMQFLEISSTWAWRVCPRRYFLACRSWQPCARCRMTMQRWLRCFLFVIFFYFWNFMVCASSCLIWLSHCSLVCIHGLATKICVYVFIHILAFLQFCLTNVTLRSSVPMSSYWINTALSVHRTKPNS